MEKILEANQHIQKKTLAEYNMNESIAEFLTLSKS